MARMISWQVDGMDCEACERRLQTVLGRLEGVTGVAADHSGGQVEVTPVSRTPRSVS
ncbi:heavy-metal-associated domain-containing protein [Pseudonocardia nigra]|uniref:heavy-metal-associated domain-containing protein n=1 Tax=Pseudonocardia nigra TaxID=1921578 RepID=UPI001C5E63F7